MKWITREHPRVDRVACPWLIEKFVDQKAEFIYVPTDRVAAEAQKLGATPYDTRPSGDRRSGDGVAVSTTPIRVGSIPSRFRVDPEHHGEWVPVGERAWRRARATAGVRRSNSAAANLVATRLAGFLVIRITCSRQWRPNSASSGAWWPGGRGSWPGLGRSIRRTIPKPSGR